jgi:tRNA modification GTPase
VRPGFDDTIAAIATPLGEAGLGVIRLSGPEAVPLASRLVQTRAPLDGAATHTLHHGWIVRGEQRLDEVVVALFRSPTSYTGEDVVEFSCHGSPAVLRTLLQWLLDSGARLARPGEFTQRAFANGRMDLAQAEAVATLIGAKSARAAQAAADQLSGGLSKRVNALRRSLTDLLADLEANLDFVEEDLPNLPQERLRDGISDLRREVENLLSTSVRGRRLREGLTVVLTGRPNVGKSSLFNALLAEERAIVTPVPGTTRDILEEGLTWNGHALTLVDTAGLRETTDPVEAEGTARARRARDRADLVVFVIDGSQPLSDEDRALALATRGTRAIAALNKSDRGARVSSADAAGLGFSTALRVSALTGEGLPALRAAVLSHLPDDAHTGETIVIVNERHGEKLAEAGAALDDAARAVAAGRSEEAVAADLRRAGEALAAITGHDVGDDVLDAIFRRFCIGK